MTDADPLFLARIQFGASFGLLLVFAAFALGLAWLLLGFRLRMRAGDGAPWREAFHFWARVFALALAAGVIAGLVALFQFGAVLPGLPQKLGNVLGPLLGLAVVCALVVQAGFLGIMLFGAGRVPGWVHVTATAIVALGLTFAAFWLAVADTWLLAPRAFEVVDGHFLVTDWRAVVLHPGLALRLAHLLLAALLTAGFAVLGTSAWRALRAGMGPAEQAGFRAALLVVAFAVPAQFVLGQVTARVAERTQPATVAAIAGLWQSGAHAPAVLWGWPDAAARANAGALGIPGAASLLLTGRPSGEVRGLDAFPGEHPPVAPVFVAFRVALLAGVLMLAAAWGTVWLLRRRGGDPARLPRGWLRLLAGMGVAGWVALLAGWYTSIVGREPWLVNGLLRVDEVGDTVGTSMLLPSIAGLGAAGAALLLAWLGVTRQQLGRGLPPAAPTPVAVGLAGAVREEAA